MLTSVCDMVRRTEAVDFVFQISETFPSMSLDSQAKDLKLFSINKLYRSIENKGRFTTEILSPSPAGLLFDGIDTLNP